MVLNPRKCEFMGFGKTNENEVFNYYEIRLKKTTTKKTTTLPFKSLLLCHNDYALSYNELLSKQGLVNIHIRNIQQLMIEILKCLTGIMNEILRLKNIAYTIRNPRVLDSRLPKIAYCGLETIEYKGPQLWQQLPAKIKK